MTGTPRLEIDLDKIHHNAAMLIHTMGKCGISVTGVTKAALGCKEIASAILEEGAENIGDSRIENIIKMRQAGIASPIILIRAPMHSQIDLIMDHVDLSFNTDISTLGLLSKAAVKKHQNHNVVLMIELGDLREGIMLENIESMVRKIQQLPHITIKGIGTNLGCQNGIIPTSQNMNQLSGAADMIESIFDIELDIVTGGNSSNLLWAMNATNTGRINNLRLGESILLGRHPGSNTPIEKLYTDAFTIVAEVIESTTKPVHPWGTMGNRAFSQPPTRKRSGLFSQTIFAIGHQDVDPGGLTPILNIELIGASSDHLIVDAKEEHLTVGTECAFYPNYSALLRAMTSPHVQKVFRSQIS